MKTTMRAIVLKRPGPVENLEWKVTGSRVNWWSKLISR